MYISMPVCPVARRCPGPFHDRDRGTGLSAQTKIVTLNHRVSALVDVQSNADFLSGLYRTNGPCILQTICKSPEMIKGFKKKTLFQQKPKPSRLCL